LGGDAWGAGPAGALAGRLSGEQPGARRATPPGSRRATPPGTPPHHLTHGPLDPSAVQQALGMLGASGGSQPLSLVLQPPQPQGGPAAAGIMDMLMRQQQQQAPHPLGSLFDPSVRGVLDVLDSAAGYTQQPGALGAALLHSLGAQAPPSRASTPPAGPQAVLQLQAGGLQLQLGGQGGPTLVLQPAQQPQPQRVSPPPAPAAEPRPTPGSQLVASMDLGGAPSATGLVLDAAAGQVVPGQQAGAADGSKQEDAAA